MCEQFPVYFIRIKYQEIEVWLVQFTFMRFSLLVLCAQKETKNDNDMMKSLQIHYSTAIKSYAFSPKFIKHFTQLYRFS